MARLLDSSAGLLRFLFTLLLVLPVLAQASAGQVIFAKGQVGLMGTDGQQRQASVGAALREGDHVVTGDRSMVQVRLSDGALVSLRSHSDYQIEVQREEEGLLEQAGKLFSGWMRSVSGSIGKSEPESVSYSTPVATIGIRGTSFQVIHIPPAGLPGYEDTPPGTYIFLEQGGVETSSDGGTRFIQPGEVVWVADSQQRPRLSPKQRDLFLRDVVRAASPEERRRESLRRQREKRSEDRRDRISDALVNDFFDPGPVTRAGLGIYSDFGFPARIRSISPNLKFAGTGSASVLTGMRMPGTPGGVEPEPELRIFANADAAPVIGSVGGRLLNDGSAISWGSWANGDYTVTRDDFTGSGPVEQTTAGDWHYIWADNPVFDLPELPSGLSGVFRYNYVGGTLLTGDGGVFSVDKGSMVVDFASRNLFTNLKVVDTFQPTEKQFRGSGSFADFYNLGVNLDESDGGFGFGRIQGIFAGDKAQGVASMVNLNINGGSTDLVTGTAAFRRVGTYDYSRVAAAGSYDNPVTFISSGNTAYLGAFDQRRLIEQSQFGPGPESRVLQVQDETALTDTGFAMLADGTEVNWGVWGGGSYTVDGTDAGGTPLQTTTPAADWHYMMASNAIFDENELLSLGLPSGTYNYFYTGGTAFTSPTGAANYAIASGQIDLTLGASASMEVISLAINAGAGSVILDSGGTAFSVTQFYDSGIQLSSGGTESGSIQGAFVGKKAEGIINNVIYNDGSDDYSATAAFQR